MANYYEMLIKNYKKGRIRRIQIRVTKFRIQRSAQAATATPPPPARQLMMECRHHPVANVCRHRRCRLPGIFAPASRHWDVVVLNHGEGVCADPGKGDATLGVGGPGPPEGDSERQLIPDRGGGKT
jgi:hypothetical protein